jgi:type IX secretion system PorP/SprF family membrane protein
MNRQKTTYPLLAFMLLFGGMAHAQDVAYSQFYANPLYLNPAMAGLKICPRFTLNYRNQWPSITKGYVNYSATYDQYFENISGALGVIVDAADGGGGLLKSVSANLIYTYRLVLSNELVANVGFQGGYYQNKLNWNDLIFEDQLSLSNGIISQPTGEMQPDRLTKGFSDFSAGFLLGYKENYYFGAAAHHLSQPNISFYSNELSYLGIKYTVHAGAYIDLDAGGRNNTEDMSLSPNIMYLQQANFHQLNLGVYLNTFPLVTGLWFRHNFENPDAVIALIGFQHKNIQAGYSYDFTISRLTNNVGGAHEVSFSWQLPCPQKDFKVKAIKCPRF